MLNISSNKKGFTLVELLLVISIISLLSSIVLTSTRGVRERALIARKIQQAGPFHRMLGVGLVGEWRFDENYDDTSGNGNNFETPAGSGISFVDSFHPAFNKAVRIPNWLMLRRRNTPASALNLGGGDVSIAAWIRIDQNCIWYCRIFSFREDQADESSYYLSRRPSTNKIYMNVGNHISLETSDIERDVWYFVVGTYNHKNKNLSIYVDAEKDVNQDLNLLPSFAWIPSTSSRNDIYAGMYFNSTLDDIRVYNEALTEAQVRKMYAEEISKKGLVSE